MPSGVTHGDLLLMIASKGTPANTATVDALAGWNELLDENVSLGLFVAWKNSDATEGADEVFTTSASIRFARIVYRITGHDPNTAPQVATTGTGTSATPDPPASATPPSSKDYLVVAFAGMAGEEADDDTWGNTPPTGYAPTPPRQIAGGIAGTNLAGLILSAELGVTTGSATNPGTFGVDASAAWRSQTILVHPAPNPTQLPFYTAPQNWRWV